MSDAEDPEEVWGCLDSSDVYRLDFASRDEALAALDGEPGAIVRCRRGFPREGLEYAFDITEILSLAEGRAESEGHTLALFDEGVLFADQVREEDLRRRIADALHEWIRSVNPESWMIVESEDVEEPTIAQNRIP